MRTWQEVHAERYPDSTERAQALEAIRERKEAILAEQRRWARRHPIAHAIDNWRRWRDGQ